MKKTLLLCFIHGFKGDDNTFGGFTEHLRALVSHAMPNINVDAVVYPKYETRGDLRDCVSRFRDWLQTKVIDLEVAAGTPSPTIDPCVRTILLGHSMGGIVAAEAAIAIASDQPVHQPAETHAFMFPYIQAILAFDTPYLGISPGLVAHGAEDHYNTASGVLTQMSSLVGGFWSAGQAASEAGTNNKPGVSSQQGKPLLALPAPPPATGAGPSTPGPRADSPTPPPWQRWGKAVIFAGALAAGGAAAYLKRDQISDQITESWSWVSTHLEFVGCLVRGEELKRRVQRVAELERQGRLGFANLYTVLGRAAGGVAVVGQERTFCSLPRTELRRYFVGQVNDAARDEASAHMSMFFPRENPGYYSMVEQAKELIVMWTAEPWYESSSTGDGDGNATMMMMAEDEEGG